MSTKLASKDPSDVKDYSIAWATLLAAESETAIATSTWSVSSPAGLTVMASPAPSINGTTTTVWVSGGSAGEQYELTNTIVTASASPRTHQRTIAIPVREL